MKNILFLLILSVIAVGCMKIGPKRNTTWFTGKVMHEGYPLHLRFPDKPDFDSLQSKFPKFLIVTHHLSELTESGVPEATYNVSLEKFDNDLINAFSRHNEGLTVLVETFGGKRTYYIYVSFEAQIDAVKNLFSLEYPQHQLQWELRNDPKWDFIRQYSSEYKLYKYN